MIYRIYLILILMLGISSSNASSYSYFTLQDIKNPEIEECIEALSKGFIVEENIYDRFNLYEILYGDSYYVIRFLKGELITKPIVCNRSIYIEQSRNSFLKKIGL